MFGMRKIEQLLLLLLLVGATSAKAFAAPVNQLTQQPLDSNEQTVFTSISIATSRNLIDQDDGNNQEYFSTNIDLSKAVTPKVFISGSLSYEQNIRYPEYNDLSDFYFTISQSDLGLMKNWRLPVALNTILPVSKMSKDINSLQAGFIGSVGVSSKPTLFQNWILSSNLSLGRLLHQFTTSANGDVLNEYLSNQSVAATYRWTRASLTMRFVHRNSMSYFGTLKESFEHSQTLNIGISPAINTSIGHTNGGDIFKANGQDRDLSFFNENSSTYFIALEMNL